MANFGIFRVEKRKASSLGGLEAENNRLEEIRLPGSDIDWDKTKTNIHLVKTENWSEAIPKILAEHGILRWRKDAVMALDALYTASPGFFEGMSQEELTHYFKACLAYHEKEFGHIINAAIHLDEKTPHMHVVSIPIFEKPDGSYTLSAKSLMGGKADFHARQDAFYEQVSSAFGLERGEVQDPAERRKHLDVLDYKLMKTEEKIDAAEAVHEDLVAAVDEKREELAVIEEKLNIYSGLKDILINGVRNVLMDIVMYVKEAFEVVQSKLESRSPISSWELTQAQCTVDPHTYTIGSYLTYHDDYLMYGGYRVFVTPNGEDSYILSGAYNPSLHVVTTSDADLSDIVTYDHRETDIYVSNYIFSLTDCIECVSIADAYIDQLMVLDGITRKPDDPDPDDSVDAVPDEATDDIEDDIYYSVVIDTDPVSVFDTIMYRIEHFLPVAISDLESAGFSISKDDYSDDYYLLYDDEPVTYAGNMLLVKSCDDSGDSVTVAAAYSPYTTEKTTDIDDLAKIVCFEHREIDPLLSSINEEIAAAMDDFLEPSFEDFNDAPDIKEEPLDIKEEPAPADFIDDVENNDELNDLDDDSVGDKVD